MFRIHARLQLWLVVTSRITQASGADQTPAVREVLGKLAAWQATLGGMIMGQIQSAEEWPSAGFYCFNRRVVYAAFNWCTGNFSTLLGHLAQLSCCGVFRCSAALSGRDGPGMAKEVQTAGAIAQ